MQMQLARDLDGAEVLVVMGVVDPAVLLEVAHGRCSIIGRRIWPIFMGRSLGLYGAGSGGGWLAFDGGETGCEEESNAST